MTKEQASHIEKVPEGRAEAYMQAARELGNITCRVIALPGETYRGNNGKRHVVGKDQRALLISGAVEAEGMAPFYERATEIEALEKAVALASADDPDIIDNQ